MERWLFILIAVAILAAMIGSWYFSADQRQRRRMRSTPRKAVRTVTEGEIVRVVGTVEGGDAITAPLSGRQCAYWRVVVQERRRSGKSSRWVTVIDDHEGVDFVIRDETGTARVSATHARALLERDHEQSSGTFNDAGTELETFLGDRGHSSRGIFFNKSMRYREGIVETGETIHVVGVGRWEPDPSPTADPAGYRDRAKRLVLEAPADGPLLLTDEAIE